MKVKYIFLFLLYCSVAFAQERSDVVKIGIIEDLSGHAAFWGKQITLGARLAEKDLRSSGKNVSVFIGDGAFQTTKGISEAQKMLFADDVDAIFVDYMHVVNAVSPIVKNAKKLLVGSCASSGFLDTNPYAFKAFLDYRKSCEEIAQIWKLRGIKNPAVLRVPFEQGDKCSEGVSSVYGEVPEMMFNIGEPLSSQASKLKQKKVDGIFFVGYEADSLNLAKALSEIKYAPYITSASDNFNVGSHLNKYKDVIEGMMTFGYTPLSNDFTQKILAFDPNNPVDFRNGIAIAYLAVTQLYEALSQCPKNDINCQVQKMSESKSSELLSFRGFKGRSADYDYQYVSWAGGSAQVIK